jgi:hypothetical protein
MEASRCKFDPKIDSAKVAFWDQKSAILGLESGFLMFKNGHFLVGNR